VSGGGGGEAKDLSLSHALCHARAAAADLHLNEERRN